MVVLYAARHRVPVPSLARWLLGLGIAATLTANMAQGWSHGPVGAVVAAWPAVSLVGSYELLVWLIRTCGAADLRPSAEHSRNGAAYCAPVSPVSALAADSERLGGSERDTPDLAWRPAGQAAGQSPVPASALATYVHRVLTCRGDTPALGSVRQVEWWEGAMAEPVRARRLTDQEGRRLLQIVRRGKHGSVRVRRAMIIMASAPGTLVPAIARLVAAGEDTVRDVIHTFNARGLAALDPRWAGGRPRLISDGDIEVIVTAARTRPEKPVQPFTRWSVRKLAGYLAGLGRPVRIGRERLRQLLHERGISFQRTRTWKESTGPDRDAKLDRIEYVTSACPDRCFASGQSGPLSIRPCHGVCRAPRKRPVRLRATYHRTHGIRCFHGCYCVGDDQLRGITREHKGAGHTLAALKSIRAARPDGYRLFVIVGAP